MGLSSPGYVLRSATTAPSNAPTTGEPVTGVLRNPHPVPSSFTLHSGVPLGAPPDFVDAHADMYRAAILQSPGTTPIEYLVWAQNTASLAWVDDPDWWVEDGKGTIPQGGLSVGDGFASTIREDGTDRVVVRDNGLRSISRIWAVVVARGDVDQLGAYDDEGWINPDDVNPSSYPGDQPRDGVNPYVTLYFEEDEQDSVAGLATLTTNHLNMLGGGLSQSRGDRIVTVHYSLASARFWWTRNDRYQTRFGWNAKTRRWEPLKGGPVKNLGVVALDGVYQLDPPLKTFPVGAFLPASSADAYAMLRVGLTPGASGTPITGVRVKSDAEVPDFDFTSDPAVIAVVGQTSGKLVFSPSFLKMHAGETIWYSNRGFVETSNGVVGPMLHADVEPIFLAPIPGPTDHPLIRFGNRTPLTPILVATDADLEALLTVAPSTVIVSLSTGRLRFHPEDVQRADPTRAVFDKFYLGESVVYSGVALNGQPQPTRAPVQLLDASGTPTTALSDELYLPDFVGLPLEFVSDDARRGLGVSGVLDVPDGTGATPSGVGLSGTLRPGGDQIGGPNLGRVRQIHDTVGDTLLFSQEGAVQALEEVTLEGDLPSMGFTVKGNRSFVARERSTHGSRVVLSRRTRRKFGNKPVYFLQASLTPAFYTTEAKLYSRNRDIFRFSGDENFYFAIDGTAYQWNPSILLAANPSLLFFTSEQVAQSLQGDTIPALPLGAVTDVNGQLQIQGDTSVEVGFGSSGVRDLSGCAVLGFPPGWRAVAGVTNWLPDSGVSLGLVRSPVNRDRSNATPDYAAVDRVEDLVLFDSVPASPFIFLNNPPLQDLAGYDEGVFFYLRSTIVDGDDVTYLQRPLQHYQDIVHRFGQGKFDWVERQNTLGLVDRPLTTLSLGTPGLVSESLLGVPSISGGLLVSEDGGSYVFQDPNNDFILPQSGTPGTVTLVHRYGNLVTYGSQGFRQSASVFQDNAALFQTRGVSEGYRLRVLSGPNVGSYRVTSVTESTLSVTPDLRSTSDVPATWEVFQGFPDTVYDPTVVADVQFKTFNHITSEPFTVRVLRRVGDVPTTMEGERPVADVAEALQRHRDISLRYGLVFESTDAVAALKPLTSQGLGVLANDTLVLPDVGTNHFLTGAFTIQVGARVLVPEGVPAFSQDPTGVEYLTEGTLGLLRFNSALLTDLRGSQVYYRQAFLDPDLLGQGEAQIDPSSGALNLSTLDMSLHQGERLYLVERLVTEERQDVSISPMSGAFSPNAPMVKGSVVEVAYWRADLEGRRIGELINEFLPVRIRKEAATLVRPNVYRFNADLAWTIRQDIEVDVWVGAILQNFGQTDCLVDFPSDWGGAGRVMFIGKQVDAGQPVLVSYSVFEAQGGERGYEASQKNIYRPPFFIKANQSRFGLRGDRTQDLIPGQMLRIGEDCFYVRSLRYFPATSDGKGDVTEVGIFPPTVTEVGSRAPGNDVVTLITDRPLTTVVDPMGPAPVTTSAASGLMSEVDIDVFPFEAVCGGQKVIIFRGNLTTFAVAGHILEIGGCPYAIASAELTEDGTCTKITVTGGFTRGFDLLSRPPVKLSYRPVYPPETRDFLGVGPVLDAEATELVLFGENDGTEKPGRTLIPEVEYHLDAGSGSIQLLGPNQSALGPQQRLVLRHTRLRSLQPVMQDQVLILPRYVADYLSVTTPDAKNGRLGATLSATYTFESPDSFYFRAVQLSQFMGEAAKEAIQEITSQQPAGGSFKVSVSGSKNWEQGTNGLKARRRHLSDLDRAARVFLEFYNQAVLSFEQVQETISGGFVGDRDGKFRFRVGHDRDYPTPGFEDPISGELSPRNLWNSVVNATRGSAVFVTPYDWVVAPDTVSLVDAEVVGSFPDSDLLDGMVKGQKILVQNDIDDLVMLRLGRVHVSSRPTFPYFEYRAKGVFARMSDQHALSRLFPTETKAFFRLLPGAGAKMEAGSAFDPGVYTAGRVINGGWARTTGQQIGQISNPVLGEISDIKEVDLSLRRARGRVWGYFPNGLPAGAFDGGLSAAITQPCVVVTPLLLRDVPIDPGTGYPDNAQFLSASGSTPDAVSGDPDLAVPGFAPKDQISWGKPDGRVFGGRTRVTDTIWGVSASTDLFVSSIQFGCVLLFEDKDGSVITDPDDVLVGEVPAHEFPISRGDTLFAVSPVGQPMVDLPDLSGTPTFQTLVDQAARNDHFRSGFDLRVKKDGSVIDRTLPSIFDPSYFALKEMMGQSPPPPTASIGGPVEFLYQGQNPLLFPALLGDWKDDSGDYALPYLRTGNTELDRFSEISVSVAGALSAKSAGGLYVYPDEILGADGTVVGGGVDPAALTTSQDLTPVLHGATDPGLGDVRAFDLLLVQTPALGEDSHFTLGLGPNLGPHGILTVGRETTSPGGSSIEPPRFVTSTKAPIPGTTATGDGVRYNLTNAMVYCDSNYPADPQVGPPTAGLKIIEDVGLGLTILDFSSVPIALNDGETLGTGNLNDIHLAGVPIQIRVFARPDPNIVFGPAGVHPLPSLTGGVEVLRLMIWQGQAMYWTYQDNFAGAPTLVALLGGVPLFGTDLAPVVPVVNNRQIHLQTTGLLPWVPFGPPPPGWAPNKWFLPHTVGAGPTYTSIYGFEFSVDLDARGYLYFAPGAPAWESSTAWIDTDRLTFHEVCDLRFSSPRGRKHPLNNALSLETELSIWGVRTGLTAADSCWSSINNGANGLSGGDPIPFTFLERGVSPAVGNWSLRSGLTTEKGSLRVMAFEGWGNEPLTTTSSVSFSALPSCDFAPGSATVILLGTGVMGSQVNPLLTTAEAQSLDSRITSIAPTLGSVAGVRSGDVAVVVASTNSNHPATVHRGTYLIRHVVVPNSGVNRKVAPRVEVGQPGWCSIHFPTVLSYDSATNILETSDLAPAPGGPLVGGVHTGFEAPGASTRVYLLVNPQNLASSDEALFRLSVVSAKYTLVSLVGGRGHFTLTDFRDANADPITEGVFQTLASIGTRVSGMRYLPVQVRGSAYGLPPNNCVGVHDGVNSIYGFQRLTLKTPSYLGVGGTRIYKALGQAGPSAGFFGIATAPSVLVPMVGTPVSSHQFQASADTAVYHWVTDTLDIRGLPAADFTVLNIPSTSALPAATGVSCVLPRMSMTLESPDGGGTVQPGFEAQGGIFLEPSFPRTCLNLTPTLSHARVVDKDHALPDPSVAATDLDRELWSRDANSYWQSGTTPSMPEEVVFSIRRIRRFHEVGLQVENLLPLRFAYEIRRGMITDRFVTPFGSEILVASSFQMDWETSKPLGAPKSLDVWDDGLVYSGTNLGLFDDPDVNIHPGDTLRLLDEDDRVVDEAEILTVLTGTSLLLAPPGLQHYTSTTRRFEIWLRQAPVPHEQTNEQLLHLVTDSTVVTCNPTWGGTEKGGFVPEVDLTHTYDDVANRLYDDLLAPGGGQTFSALGVRSGDIVVIDPMGKIPKKAGLPSTQESGSRPFGDDGVQGRVDHATLPVFTAGRPSPLDDNRGFYRVKKVVDTENPPYLLVDPLSDFTGAAAAPVVFDPLDSTRAYAVYPTVSDSTLSANHLEGQMDLRPTRSRNPVTGSFKSYVDGLNKHSLRPFRYQVVRPSQVFEAQTIDLVLMMRERMLSLIELIRYAGSAKGGSYYIFQRDVHLSDVGSPTDFNLGLGVASNDYLRSLVGRVEVMPFANNSTALSLLDRRFWILDTQLDSLTFDAAAGIGMKRALPGDPTYSAFNDPSGALVRPVLADRVGEVLNQTERLRELRSVWLSYRTHKVLGTLSALTRYDAELPLRLLEQEQYLLKLMSLEKV